MNSGGRSRDRNGAVLVTMGDGVDVVDTRCLGNGHLIREPLTYPVGADYVLVMLPLSRGDRACVIPFCEEELAMPFGEGVSIYEKIESVLRND